MARSDQNNPTGWKRGGLHPAVQRCRRSLPAGTEKSAFPCGGEGERALVDLSRSADRRRRRRARSTPHRRKGSRSFGTACPCHAKRSRRPSAGVQVSIRPSIEDGFYYDLNMPKPSRPRISRRSRRGCGRSPQRIFLSNAVRSAVKRRRALSKEGGKLQGRVDQRSAGGRGDGQSLCSGRLRRSVPGSPSPLDGDDPLLQAPQRGRRPTGGGRAQQDAPAHLRDRICDPGGP